MTEQQTTLNTIQEMTNQVEVSGNNQAQQANRLRNHFPVTQPVNNK